ncbi:putative reverse transcriptase domain-containing protein [Tanacetum coccineum]
MVVVNWFSDRPPDIIITSTGSLILLFLTASDTKSDLSEDLSLDHIPSLSAISPFLSSADDTTDSDTPPSLTHAPGQSIPYHRPYQYHLKGPLHMLTARKRVGMLPTHRLAVRHYVDHSSSDYFSPDDSAQDSSLDSSLEASSDFHSDASSDSSSRHSLPDHSSPDLPSTFARPSHKRRRSPMTSVPALSPASGALSPVSADLIPSPKRVRDFDYLEDVEVDSRESSEPSRSRGTDIGVDDEIERVDESRGINVRVVAETVVLDEVGTDTRDIVKGGDDKVTHLVMLDDVQEAAQEERAAEGVQREQGRRIFEVESAVTALTERIMSWKGIQNGLDGHPRVLRGRCLTHDWASRTQEEIEDLVSHRVAKEMEAREAAMNLEPLNESRDEKEGENGGNGNGENGGNRNKGNGGNGKGGNGGNGNGENRNGNGGNGNGVRNGNGNRNGNHGMNYGGFMPVARECTFQDFLKCKPHNFSGTEGVVGLSRWFDKMETVLNISNCPSKYQVKYATCTLQDSSLTWWNSYKRTIGVDVAHAMKWAGLMKLMTENSYRRTIGVDAAYAIKWVGLMKLMTEVYCPRNEIQKMETELIVPDEEDIVERFIRGLPDNIQGNGYAARSIENKRMIESNPRDNHGQQLPNVSGLNVARAYTADNNEKRGSTAAVPNTQRALFRNQQGVICYECGRPGHVKRDCPKLRNQNHGIIVGNKTGNKIGNNKATVRAYAIGGGGANPDSNVFMGTFLLNNYYASMLFDSGADRSFVSLTFSALLDVAPSALDTSYAVEFLKQILSLGDVH